MFTLSSVHWAEGMVAMTSSFGFLWWGAPAARRARREPTPDSSLRVSAGAGESRRQREERGLCARALETGQPHHEGAHARDRLQDRRAQAGDDGAGRLFVPDLRIDGFRASHRA